MKKNNKEIIYYLIGGLLIGLSFYLFVRYVRSNIAANVIPFFIK